MILTKLAAAICVYWTLFEKHVALGGMRVGLYLVGGRAASHISRVSKFRFETGAIHFVHRE